MKCFFCEKNLNEKYDKFKITKEVDIGYEFNPRWFSQGEVQPVCRGCSHIFFTMFGELESKREKSIRKMYALGMNAIENKAKIYKI